MIAKRISFRTGLHSILMRRSAETWPLMTQAALIAFYDSLHSLADFVNDWWEREGQLPVSIFNMILHHAHTSLELALVCVEKFDLETLYPPPYEAWGTISFRIERSLAAEAEARKHHITRYEAKAANKAPTLPQRARRG